jgi:hypothetical protein
MSAHVQDCGLGGDDGGGMFGGATADGSEASLTVESKS